jgi:hypothetical protein
MRAKIVLFVLVLILFALPVLAQEAVTHNVAFDGISFSFDSIVGDNVNISQYPGDPVEGAGPGFSNAAHTQFNIGYLPQAPDSFFDSTAGIRVFKTADLAQYDFLQAQVDQLQGLIADQTDLSQYEVPLGNNMEHTLPYVPVLTHGQVLRAQAHYIETDALTGIAYLTYYAAASEPLLSNSFYYTVQAISKDGQYYVSANFKPTTDLFPAEIPADFDPATFNAQMGAYLVESIATLDAASAEDFSPPLATFDAIIESMQFEG